MDKAAAMVFIAGQGRKRERERARCGKIGNGDEENDNRNIGRTGGGDAGWRGKRRDWEGWEVALARSILWTGLAPDAVLEREEFAESDDEDSRLSLYLRNVL